MALAWEPRLTSKTRVTLADYPDGGDPYPLVRDVLSTDEGITGVADQMWAAHVLALQQALPRQRWCPATPVLAPVRARKSPAEVAALAEAGQAIDAVHQKMGRWLRPGRTEAEVAVDIAAAMRATGHTRVDFVIVASGPNAATPHHQPGRRRIEPGDPVVVDLGGTMPSGYCSDCTRTYLVKGPAPTRFLDYYQVLQSAQRAAVAAVAPGVSAQSVDAAAPAAPSPTPATATPSPTAPATGSASTRTRRPTSSQAAPPS